MKKYFKNIIYAGLTSVFVCSNLLGGIHSDFMTATQPKPSPKGIFEKIEAGIAAGNVNDFSLYFGGRTYLSLADGPSGYYSSSQAYYVLQEYFRRFKPYYFKFSSMNSIEEPPYASGSLRYEYRGVRNSSRVYVSLKYSGTEWKITQITIN